jgi:hypothetical protein
VSRSQTSPSEPPEEVIELLNAVDKGLIGIDKPKIVHREEEPLSYRTEHEAKLADGDFLVIDNGF